MEIISVNLGYLNCSKDPNHISEVISEGIERKFSLKVEKYDIKEKFNVIAGMNISFLDPNKKREIASYKCYVVIKVTLNKKELKLGKTMEKEINYFVLSQAWSIFESQAEILRDLKIDLKTFPPPPSRDALESILSKDEQPKSKD